MNIYEKNTKVQERNNNEKNGWKKTKKKADNVLHKKTTRIKSMRMCSQPSKAMVYWKSWTMVEMLYKSEVKVTFWSEW